MAEPVLDITAQTQLLAVLGHPVHHSLSPHIHNAALQAQGLDIVYLAFDVPPARLSAAIEGLRAIRALGANITVPHKEVVPALLDDVDPTAARVGAVNTIVQRDGRLSGYNTDIEGFRDALRSQLPSGAEDRRCLVVGAGGAARAVVAALIAERAAAVAIFNRTSTRADALCAAARSWGARSCGVVTEEALPKAVESADIVVNATTVGLDPASKEVPFPVDTVTCEQVVLDLVYGPAPTPLVRHALERGASAIDGREMLLRQAASSYRLWTGLEAPLEVMRAALTNR